MKYFIFSLLLILSACKIEPTPKPTPTPSPTPVDAISITEVTWLHSSPASFPVTATLSDVKVVGQTITWNWTHPGWKPTYDSDVGGNMWVFAKIGGKWYAATWEWLRVTNKTVRSTLEAKVGEPPFIQSKRNPINAWYPTKGEQVGWMISTACRSGCVGEIKGRSPIVLTNW